MSLRQCSHQSWQGAAKMMAKDTGLALIGLAVSLILAFAVNDAMQSALMEAFGF